MSDERKAPALRVIRFPSPSGGQIEMTRADAITGSLRVAERMRTAGFHTRTEPERTAAYLDYCAIAALVHFATRIAPEVSWEESEARGERLGVRMEMSAQAVDAAAVDMVAFTLSELGGMMRRAIADRQSRRAGMQPAITVEHDDT